MSNSTSPVTGIIEESEVIIDFGQHQGRTVEQLAHVDRTFYEMLAAQRETGAYSIRRQRDKTFRLYVSPLAARLFEKTQ